MRTRSPSLLSLVRCQHSLVTAHKRYVERPTLLTTTSGTKQNAGTHARAAVAELTIFTLSLFRTTDTRDDERILFPQTSLHTRPTRTTRATAANMLHRDHKETDTLRMVALECLLARNLRRQQQWVENSRPTTHWDSAPEAHASMMAALNAVRRVLLAATGLLSGVVCYYSVHGEQSVEQAFLASASPAAAATPTSKNGRPSLPGSVAELESRLRGLETSFPSAMASPRHRSSARSRRHKHRDSPLPPTPAARKTRKDPRDRPVLGRLPRRRALRAHGSATRRRHQMTSSHLVGPTTVVHRPPTRRKAAARPTS